MNTRRLTFLLLGCLLGSNMGAQVRLSELKGGVYTQDFDGLPAPVEQAPWAWVNDGNQNAYGMPGWYIVSTTGASAKPLSGAKAYLSAAGKNPNAVASVNYGGAGSTDRAIGFRMSTKGALNAQHTFYAGVVFVNDTPSAIGRVTISYLGEQWSKTGGGVATEQTLRVACANLGRTFVPAKFAVQRVAPVAEVPSLEFRAEDDATKTNRYGGAAPLRTAKITSTIAFPRALAPGEHLFLLWTAKGNGEENGVHALALDNVQIQFTADSP